jgi:hypothetical protein
VIECPPDGVQPPVFVCYDREGSEWSLELIEKETA